MPRYLQHALAALTLAGLITGSAFAGGEGWTEDFDGAKKTAESEGKDMLLDFTGSDWCGWCIKLNNEVFSQDAFKDFAKESLVLVELDYPNKKPQTEEIKAQNAKLKEAYAIRGYPTIFLTDAMGRPYAQTGYQRGGAEAYVEHIKQLQQVRIERDKHLAAAKDAEGVEKAKHLHEAMKAVGEDLALAHYEATVKQIIDLDPENKAGLKEHYGDLYAAKALESKIQTILSGARNDPQGALTKLDELLKEQDLPKKSKQVVLAFKSQIQLFSLQDKPAAKVTLQQAIDADPDSEIAEQLRAAMKQFFPDAAEGDAS